mgnify:CR=1 FL=1
MCGIVRRFGYTSGYTDDRPIRALADRSFSAIMSQVDNNVATVYLERIRDERRQPVVETIRNCLQPKM